ncbi:MAG TPA: UDP-N-acetylmuramate dehydrogenase [Actinomycetales bacterium]|nr:UDP-N-acetylmuramate dehydrogenase [Actinomycetales bacterium]
MNLECVVPIPADGPKVHPVRGMAMEGSAAGAPGAGAGRSGSPGSGTTPTLAELTTFHVGGEIGTYVEAQTEAEFIDAIRAADAAEAPLLVLGGGSNILPADEPFEGVVVRDMRRGIEGSADSTCVGALITAPAGQPWDELVAHTIQEEWMGIEALSGIPGTVGAAPIQNVGAYGQEVAETLSNIRVYDRLAGRTRLFAMGELQLGYRDSLLKRSLRDPEAGGGRIWGPTGRWVVLEVSFQMRLASLSRPIAYGELARKLDVELGDRANSREVREAVLELRRGKGMVLDPADHDSWSAGSFFTNPILSDDDAAHLPLDAPRYPVTDHTKIASIAGAPVVVEGKVKTSAAWLIQHAGFPKGFALPGSRAALSSKHVLALTNRGGATGAELRELRDHIVAGVEDAFGITLVPEPVIL